MYDLAGKFVSETEIIGVVAEVLTEVGGGRRDELHLGNPFWEKEPVLL